MTLEHRIGKLEDFTMPHKIINALSNMERAHRVIYLFDQEQRGKFTKKNKKAVSRLAEILKRAAGSHRGK